MITKKDRKTLLEYIKSDFCMCLSNNESIRLENIFTRYIKSNKNAKILTIYNDVHALFDTDKYIVFCVFMQYLKDTQNLDIAYCNTIQHLS